MQSERAPAVAGSFYPGDPSLLERDLDGYLANADQTTALRIRALIVPHAGYVYSGPVAASAYSLLSGDSRSFRRVLLLGPSHFVRLDGHALPSVSLFRTPLGPIAIDREGVERVADFSHAVIDDAPHESEHSLEVQLPFLQRLLGDFQLLPVAVGLANAEATADLIESEWDREDTLTVISTDLSHYLSWSEAREIDSRTAAAIESLSRTDLRGDEACGCYPLNGIIEASRRNHLEIRRLDLRNSGDTAGSKERVVGYGAWVVSETS